MLAGDWAARIEGDVEQPDLLLAMRPELEADQDVSDRERQQLADRLAQYLGDARNADPEMDVDDEDDGT